MLNLELVLFLMSVLLLLDMVNNEIDLEVQCYGAVNFGTEDGICSPSERQNGTWSGVQSCLPAT
jgi:hypothetical protein